LRCIDLLFSICYLCVLLFPQFYTFNMFDAQAWWARDVILGKISLPSQEEMQQASVLWEEKEAAIGQCTWSLLSYLYFYLYL
jgi:hypothetical protein